MTTTDSPGRVAHRRPAWPAPYRVSFFFSAQGDHAAFLRDSDGSGLGVETWAWHSGAPRRRILSTSGENVRSQPLPLGDGRVLVLRAGAGVHDLVLLSPGQQETSIGRVPSRGLFLLPSPEAGTLAVARGMSDDGTPRLWLVKAASLRIEEVPLRTMLRGFLLGGHWLDEHGRMLGFDCYADGRTLVLTVDLATGHAEVADFASAGDKDGDKKYRLMLSEPRSGRLLVAEESRGKRRFGWGSRSQDGWELTFPGGFGDFDGMVTPLAIDPAGNSVAFSVDHGLRSEVAICEPGARAARKLNLPSGTFLPIARWTSQGLHLVVTRPDQPANITTVMPGTDQWRMDSDPAPPDGWAAAHTETLAGPAGPIEAVIYGGPRWRDVELLLIALHGGPHAAWKMCFDPLAQDLAAAGIAVVALNQRGSLGYGAAHRDAIRGAWGGPDLADVTHLARGVSAYRRQRGLARLMLMGVSYGAFLALLTAAAEPALWSHCAAISPFCSAASLDAAAPESVRSFLRRLDALGVIDDGLGPRDLERLAGQITARVFIAHGTGDEKIPTSEPRRIVAALERAGRRRGTDYLYREDPGEHDIIFGPAGADLRRELIRFLCRPVAKSCGETSLALVERT